jgi:hypothetical protein
MSIRLKAMGQPDYSQGFDRVCMNVARYSTRLPPSSPSTTATAEQLACTPGFILQRDGGGLNDFISPEEQYAKDLDS